ncbi:hypothetical protein SAMN04488078_10051 [Antarctobacter heliothermus]|uniref:Uncharacterized protein n=1 Tax=Antarctobacter heliothermus TaxID=74033 RepID=A0A239BY45_9RHOB|nr:hypothetical protein SAMN04488078_10051 [Antarctobacter heliothermus]
MIALPATRKVKKPDRAPKSHRTRTAGEYCGMKVLATSGILPAAVIAIVLNLVLPEELTDESTEEVSGGMSGHAKGSLVKDNHV